MGVSEFEVPDFLEADEEEIHDRMIENPPRNYDVSEGSLFFDVTKPVAMEIGKTASFNLSFSLQMMFPQFAEGDFLDYHGESVSSPRHPAEKSNGFVTFKGENETTIPEDTVVMTAGDDEDSPIRFETIEEAKIDGGSVEVPVKAMEAGKAGNVPPDSVQLLDESIGGVTSVNNEKPTENGEEEEGDEHYRGRILNQRKNQALSGSRKDYRIWAMEVEGVEDAIVIPEAKGYGKGSVKIIIVPRGGRVAPDELIDEVQEHIAPDGRKGGGLAPIGSKVIVDTADLIDIDVKFDTIEFNRSKEETIQLLKENLTDYFSDLPTPGLVKYPEVASVIINTKGISDYKGLLINNGTNNISLNDDEAAVVGEVKY